MKILFFSTAREAVGCVSDEIALSGTASVDEVWAKLIARHPSLSHLRESSRLTCNEAYADGSTIFRETDVAAVIPPVSGG